MKLFFRGHDEKYAVEQTMLTLFPSERPLYPEEAPGGDNELELSFSRVTAGPPPLPSSAGKGRPSPASAG